MTRWHEYDPDSVRVRYNRLAPFYVPLQYLLATPPKFRRRVVERLCLRPGDHALEVGVGSGRELRHLIEAVGTEGRVTGVDFSEEMLARARRCCEKNGWKNVTLLQGDASNVDILERFQGVLFCLSYSVMKNHRQILRGAWDLLEPGGRIVIADVRVPETRLRRIVEPCIKWISHKTVLGNPDRRPWEDLREFAENIGMETFSYGGGYFVCWGAKPGKVGSER